MRRGVTLLELLIVVSIIAAIASVSFPALTAGMAGVRLTSASGSVASFLTAAINQVERHEEAAAIVVDPKHDTLSVFTAQSGDKPKQQLDMPQGVHIEGEEPRRFTLFPGGAFPRIGVILRGEKGARRSIQIDPVTAVPKIERLQ